MRMSRGWVAVAALLASAIAHAQGGDDQADFPPVEDWSYETLYQKGGLRADTLLGASVLGEGGDEIGNVQEVVFDGRNRILGVVAEVGTGWEVGDTHLALPFDQLRFTSEGVHSPVTEDNLGQFRLFGGNSFVDPQALQYGPGAPPQQYVPGAVQNGHSERMRSQDPEAQGDQAQERRSFVGQWRVSSLMNDYATFADGAGYGYVEDVLIDPNGRIQAVVVQTAAEAFREGHFAFPFIAYAGGWQPGDPTFVIPYARENIQRVPAFRFDQYDDLLE